MSLYFQRLKIYTILWATASSDAVIAQWLLKLTSMPAMVYHVLGRLHVDVDFMSSIHIKPEEMLVVIVEALTQCRIVPSRSHRLSHKPAKLRVFFQLFRGILG